MINGVNSGKAKARIGDHEIDVEVSVFWVQRTTDGRGGNDCCDQLSFLEENVRDFEHFGGVPHRCIYDNLSPAVARMSRLARLFHHLI